MNLKPSLFAAASLATALVANAADNPTQVHHRTMEVQGINVFYREAGPAKAPVVLLLHGFGASSYMFRDLIPQLATKYHVIAPDLPGFGQTSVVPGKQFAYTFDNLAAVIDAFTVAKGAERYAMYVFDYGAPVGWRLAVKNPQKITAIVSQNGNAYEEGLSEGWADMRKAWAEPTAANREVLRRFNTLDVTKWQYTEGERDASLIAPETWQLAHAAIERVGVEVHSGFTLRFKNSSICVAISLPWVSMAKWPASRKRTSALGLSRLNASAPTGRKNGSFLPQIANVGGRLLRKNSCSWPYCLMF